MKVLSLVVEDQAGVLARVSALCARRAINIHSLAVGPTHEPGRSRVTLVVDADKVEQASKQLHKLVNVIKITEFATEESVEREIMLVRVNGAARRSEVLDQAAPFGAEVVDATGSSVAFQVVGHPRHLAGFLDAMRPFGVVDLVKSGRIAMARDQGAGSEEQGRRAR
jgi:acetolactate synthase-1/3 small subunit